MARPRKDSGRPDARRRLVEAFWELLEANRMRSITVGMIADRAQCNRGTFYYHFADIDALAFCAIEELLLGDGAVPRTLFELLAGADCADPLERAAIDLRFRRFSLIMQKGEMRQVDDMAKAVVVEKWRALLCPDGSPLKPEALLVIEHAASAMMGVVSYVSRHPEAIGEPSSMVRSYFKECSLLTASWLCKIQGQSPRLVLDRIAEAVERPAAARIPLPERRREPIHANPPQNAGSMPLD